MFKFVKSICLDILPSPVSTALANIGAFLAPIGRFLLQGLALVGYAIVKFALNIIDFLQLLVQKLAGIEGWMNLEKLNLDNLQETDIVFRFLFSDTVLKVFRTMFGIFLVLLLVFTILAIIKNEYSNAVDGGDMKNHKKSLYAALKAVFTVIFVPFVLIVGILSSNAVLAGLAKAFNINGNLTLGGQIFVASAYDASSYRTYAKDDNRKFVSNRVNFTYTIINSDGEEVTINAKVSSAIPVLNPKDNFDYNKFTGFMFTHNASDYYLWHCEPSESQNYYYYIKYILGAYIVEEDPRHLAEEGRQFETYNANATQNNETVAEKVKAKYNSLKDGMTANISVGIANGSLAVNAIGLSKEKGYFTKVLHKESGVTDFIAAAYNTWKYNNMLETYISGWNTINASLSDNNGVGKQFSALNGSVVDARVISNSEVWGKLHDGGKYGFSPLAVEYLVMADVIDFMVQNGITMYFVNATNTNINWYANVYGNDCSVDYSTRYEQRNADKQVTETGLLVKYKEQGTVAYKTVSEKSELDGAIYIVCYYNAATDSYVPLVNNRPVIDDKGNKYDFKSSEYSDDYRGAVIARAMFKSSTQAFACDPTYISATMVADTEGADFDSKLKVAAKLDMTSIKYNYVDQLTNQTANNVLFSQTVDNGDIFYSESPNMLSIYTNQKVEGDYEYDISKLYDYLYKENVTEDNRSTFENHIKQTIAQPIVDFVLSQNPDYELFIDESSIILEEDLDGFTGNITIELKHKGKLNPQKFVLALDLYSQEKIMGSSRNSSAIPQEFCKIDFIVSMFVYGDNSSPVLEDIPQLELTATNLPDKFIAINNGKISYFIQDDNSTESNADQLFYQIDDEWVYDTQNVEKLLQLVVDNIKNGQTNEGTIDASIYSYLAELVDGNITNYTVDLANKSISFVVWNNRHPGDPRYDNAAKFVVTLQFTNQTTYTYTEVIPGEDGNPDITSDTVYNQVDLTATISKYPENFALVTANNVEASYSAGDLFYDASENKFYLYTDNNLEKTDTYLKQTVSQPIVDFILSQNPDYELFNGDSSIILEVNEGNFTGNITIELKHKDQSNPQKHTVKLTFNSQSEVLSVNERTSSDRYSKLYKIVFDADYYVVGSNDMPIIADQEQPEYVTTDRPFIVSSNGNLEYFVLDDGDNYNTSDELFYQVDETWNYVGENVNKLQDLVVNLLKNSQTDEDDTANSTYKVVAEDGQNYMVDLEDESRSLSFVVYKISNGETSYNNTAKFVVTISFVERQGNISLTAKYGNEIYMKDYNKFTLTTSITRYSESLTLISANNKTNSDENSYIYHIDNSFRYYANSSLFSANGTEMLRDNAINIAKEIASLYYSTNGVTAVDMDIIGNTVVVSGVDNNTVITFDIRNYTKTKTVVEDGVAKTVPDTSSNYYIVKCTARLNYNSVGSDLYHVYSFDVGYKVLNTFNLYSDNKNKTTLINKVTQEDPTDPTKTEEVVVPVTIEDLKDEGSKTYSAAYETITADDRVVTQYVQKRVYQYSYEKNNTSYVFNAVYNTGNFYDNGYTFISIGTNSAENDGWNDNIQFEKDLTNYKEESLVYKVGNLRMITLADYSFVVPVYTYVADGVGTVTSYDIYVLNVENPSNSGLQVYKLNVAANATSLPMYLDNNGMPVGNDTAFEIFTYNQGTGELNKLNNAIGDQNFTAAKKYFLERVSLTNYSVGIDQYVSNKVSVTDDVIRQITVTTATGETLTMSCYVSKDIYNQDTIYNSFNNYLYKLQIVKGDTATELTSKVVTVDALKEQIKGLVQEPLTIICCRDNLGIDILIDFEFHIASFSEGFEFRWRTPKLGIAKVQTNNGLKDNAIITLSRGAFALDYSFSGPVKVQNVYQVAQFNWIILPFAIVLIFNILGNAVWGLIRRLYEITLLFLIMPAVASTMPLDGKGEKFSKWRQQLVSQVLGAWGVTIGLNFFFILMPVIREASAIFTDKDVAGLNSSIRFFVGNADRLNMLVYLLFLLVAFTMLKTVPKMISEYAGGNDVISQGADTKKSAVESVNEAGKTISGKAFMDSLDKAKKMGGSLVPGSEIQKAVSKWNKKRKEKNEKDKKDNTADPNAEARNEQNKQIAEEKRQEQLEKAKELQNRRDQLAAKDEPANDANPNAEANVDNVDSADTADNLSQSGKDALKQEILGEAENYAQRAEAAADQAAALAEAQQLRSDIDNNTVHDYVGDQEKAAQEQAEAEKQQRKEYLESVGGRRGEKAQQAVEAVEEELREQRQDALNQNGRRASLSDADIDAFNARHAGEAGFVKLLKSSDKEEREKLTKQQKKEQKATLAKAEQEQYTKNLEDKLNLKKEIAEDAKNGIYRGLRGSFVRGVIGGRKTSAQRAKDAEAVTENETKLAELNENKEIYAKQLDKLKDQAKRAKLDKGGYATQLEAFNNGDFKNMSEAVKKEYDKEHGKGAFDKLKDIDKFNIAHDGIKERLENGAANNEKQLEKTEKALKKAEERAADDSKGLGHFVGKTARGAGRVVAAKGSAAAHALGLGYTKEERQQLKQEKLTNKENELASAAKKEKDFADMVAKMDEKSTDSFFALRQNEEFKKYDKWSRSTYDKYKEEAKANGKRSKSSVEQYAREKTIKDFKEKVANEYKESVNGGVQKSYADFMKKKNAKDEKLEKKADKQFTKMKSRLEKEANEELAAKRKADLKDKKLQRGLVDEASNYGDVLKTSYAKNLKKRYVKYIKGGADEATAKQTALIDVKKKVSNQAQKIADKQRLQDLRRIKTSDLMKVSMQSGENFASSRTKAASTIAKTSDKLTKKAEQELTEKLNKKLLANKKMSEAEKTDIRNIMNKSQRGEELTSLEKKKFEKFVNTSAAKKSSNVTAARQNLAKNADIINAVAEKEFKKGVNALKKDIENSKLISPQKKEALNKYISENLKKSHISTKEISDTIKKEIRSEFQRMSKKGLGSDASIAEVKKLQEMVNKLNASNRTYNRSLKSLQEANKKLTKQVKDQKSKSALAQATRTGGNFGDNASGK